MTQQTQQTFDILSQVKISEITYISRLGDNFYLGFETTEDGSYHVADKVYTGNVGMNGKLGVSRVFKVIRKVEKTVTNELKVLISKDEAKAYHNMINAEGYELRRSTVVSKQYSLETGQPVEWALYVVKNNS